MTSISTDVTQRPGLVPADETVRWTGAPRGGLLLRERDLWEVPLSLLWGGVFIAAGSAQVRSGVPFAVVLGGGLVAIGVYAIAGHFVWDAYVRAQTRYLVTDHAAYIVRSGVVGEVQRFAGPGLYDVRLERNPDGSGTMRFGPDPPGIPFSRTPPPPRAGFEAIRDLDGAYAAVLDAQRG